MAKKKNKKSIYLSVRLSKEEEQLLDELCEYHIRYRSDLIRYLIITEHRRITEIKRLRGDLGDELNENN